MKVLDLFSGIGGFSLGLERAGMETVAFCELDDFCGKVLNKNFPNVPLFKDIKQLNKELLIERGIGKIEIVCGGFPCQPFSNAGKKKGRKDDRDLWPEMFRVIKETNPTWVIGENVTGFIGMEFTRTKVDLESLGYSVQPFIIPACAVGAQHRRDRVWIIAHLDRTKLWPEQKPGSEREREGLTGHDGEERLAPHIDSDGRESNTSLQAGDENSCLGNLRIVEKESIANTNSNGLNGEANASTKENSERSRKDHRRSKTTTDFGYWWANQSDMGRVVYGFSSYPHIDAEREGFMDRADIILNSINDGTLIINYETSEIFSRKVRGREGELVKLKPSLMNGYLCHNLSYKGIKKTIKVHQVIWISRNGRVPEGMVIDHIDRNKQNNHIGNLRVATLSENAQNKDFTKLGMSTELKEEVAAFYEHSHMTMREVGLHYGISKSRVGQILNESRRNRVKALGNAVVPAIVEIIGRAILELENAK